MTQAEATCDAVIDLMGKDARHLELHECAPDLDGITAHAILLVKSNECMALIEAICALDRIGRHVSAYHRLHGRLEGAIEIDIQLGAAKVPKSWHVYERALTDTEVSDMEGFSNAT